MRCVKCLDKFSIEVTVGVFLDVQNSGIHQVYKKHNQLYFKPYNEEEQVASYFSNDIIIVKNHEIN